MISSEQELRDSIRSSRVSSNWCEYMTIETVLAQLRYAAKLDIGRAEGIDFEEIYDAVCRHVGAFANKHIVQYI